jgi:glycosyltransferase involved in cell wall biosynthesis
MSMTPPILLTSDAVGGVWRYSLELAAGLALPVVMAVLGPAPDAAQRAEAAAIPGLQLVETGLALDWTARDPGELAKAAAALAALARQAGAELAHLHAPALADADWEIPVVVVAHSCVASWWDAVHGGALPDDLAWRAAATARGMARADAVIAPSHAFAASLGRLYRPRPIHVVHNGSDSAPLPPLARRDVVLTAGRLWDLGKNLRTLDEAARELPIEAAGPVHGADGSRIAFSHLRLLGNLSAPALRQAMAARAVFASSAIYEPFGLAVLEAAQSGMALVLADTPGFRELWQDAAVFVPATDSSGFAQSCAALLADPTACAAAGRTAQARARCFTRAAMVAGTEAVHRAVAAAEVGWPAGEPTGWPA